MDFDLKERIFDPTMSVVTRTSIARVPEGARQAPHSSQFSSADLQIIGKTNANTENTSFYIPHTIATTQVCCLT